MNAITARLSLSLMILPITACAASYNSSYTTTDTDRLRGDEATAREAIHGLVQQGPDAIPELRLALQDKDPKVQRRARTALGRITGQWGSEDGLIWQRSVESAKNTDKPLMVLHLFGNFDEEFC